MVAVCHRLCCATRHHRPLWAAQDGVSAIEFAFISGILSILILGICDFGVGFWEQMQVSNAALAGAQFALKNGYDSSNIQTAVLNSTNLGGMQASPDPVQVCGCPDTTNGVTVETGTPPTCTFVCPDGSIAGTFVTVSAQVSYRTLFAWPLITNPMTLASSTTVRLN
jgi:Flp pilus assembly protein TadG